MRYIERHRTLTDIALSALLRWIRDQILRFRRCDLTVLDDGGICDVEHGRSTLGAEGGGREDLVGEAVQSTDEVGTRGVDVGVAVDDVTAGLVWCDRRLLRS